MRKIPLSEISPSPNPIRKTWDEGKMEELVLSIKEQGVIVPIKVRPNGSGYEIVYGHRRAEACRQLGRIEINAWVEEIENYNALCQQVMENESKEDVPYLEKAEGYEALLNHPDNPKPGRIDALARRTGIKSGAIRYSQQWLKMVHEGAAVEYDRHNTLNDEGIMSSGVGREGSRGVLQTIEIDVALKDDIPGKRAVAKKAATDFLTRSETRAVADAYRVAGTPELS